MIFRRGIGLFSTAAILMYFLFQINIVAVMIVLGNCYVILWYRNIKFFKEVVLILQASRAKNF